MTIKKFIESPFRILSLILFLQCVLAFVTILYFTFFVTYIASLFLIIWFGFFGILFFSLFLPKESLTTHSYKIFFKGYPQAIKTWWELVWR